MNKGFLLALAIIVGGCGRTGHQPLEVTATSQTPAVGAIQVRALNASEQLSFTLVKLEPLPASSDQLSSQDMLQRIQSTPPPELRTKHDSAELVLASLTDDTRATKQLDGSLVRLFVRRPSWILFIRGAPVTSSGPPDRPHTTSISDVFIAYDAVSGVELEQISGATTGNCPLPADGLPDGCGGIGRKGAVIDGVKR
jgi:hypothetical protein